MPTLAETSGRVVPILCPLMSDPEKPVREQAFKVSFLNYLFTYQGGLGGLTGLGGKLSTLAETSGRFLPILCPLMSYPEKPVREQAFKISF